MSVTISEFKKRFGKKPVDEVSAEDRYKTRFEQYKGKLKAGTGRGETQAVATLRELKALTGVKDWHGAADLLEEIAPKIAVDHDRAAKLRQDVAAEAKRASPDGWPLSLALQGAQKAIETAIVEDDYDDADDQLDDFKQLIDDHLQRADEWNKKTQVAEGKLKEVELRRQAENVKAPAPEEITARNAIIGLKNSILASDFAEADKRLLEAKTQLAILLKEPADKSPDGLKELYDKQLPIARTGTVYWQKVAGDASWASLKGGIGDLQAKFIAADDAYDRDDFAAAWKNLDAVMSGLGQMDAAGKALYEQARSGVNFADVVGKIKDHKVPVTDVTKTLDLKAMESADGRRFAATLKKDWITALRETLAVKADYATLERELAKAPVAAPQQAATVSPKTAEYELKLKAGPSRAEMLALLTSKDFDPAAFRAAKGATKMLDDMVAAIGGKADSKDKQEFVKEAMKCRFGLTQISGGDGDKGMSTKALPRLYQLFGILPASHTTDNDMITSLERQKAHDTSWHSGNEKKVVLKAGKTDKAGGTFDSTTLHEIAHGVDLKLKFMDTNGAARKFGGWRKETKDAVKAVAGDGLGFYGAFKGRAPDALLEKYLDVALAGGDPKTLQAQFKDGNDASFADPAKLVNDAAVKHADGKRKAVSGDTDQQRDLMFAARKLIKEREPGRKAILVAIVDLVAYNKAPADAVKSVLDAVKFTGTSPADAVWNEMAVHPAVDFAANVGLKNGANGLWDQGDAGADRCALNGRVYQESYAGDWRSYLLTSRKIKVSNYQFRHPMEWFAEVYAEYFMRKLASSHPLFSWLEEQEGKKKPASSGSAG